MARIIIDPGHTGGYNVGVCPGYFEGNTMMKLALHLRDALKARGADVTLTRTNDTQNPTLSQRGQMASDADLFISLHSDDSDNPNIRGVTSYISVKQPETRPFATEIGEAVAKVMGNQFRGTIARPSTTTPNTDYLGVLRSAVAAGAKNAFLIEHGFHSNMQDCLFLSKDENLEKIANAEADVIANHFKLSGNSKTTAKTVMQATDDSDDIAVIAPTVSEAVSEPVDETINEQVSSETEPDITTTEMPTEDPEPVVPAVERNNVASSDKDDQSDLINFMRSSRPSKPERPTKPLPPSHQPPRPIPPIIVAPNPSCPACPACRFYYTVQPSDSLYNIGHKFGVPWQDIARANGIISPFSLTTGSKIIIPLPTE
ncbi:MAG: N-acetylmuramoyl-L-alanine amidase [Bacillota bacterium]|nr:N-acetylmuramoyl-L-alanine amidase [Bacillota bacterium]